MFFLIANGITVSPQSLSLISFWQYTLGACILPESRTYYLYIRDKLFLSLRKCFMLFSYLFDRKSSKLCLTPKHSSSYVNKPILIMESMFSDLFIWGDLTTMIKSYSAFGPSLSVILFVSSFDTGFSMNHDSYFISLLTIEFFIVSISNGALFGVVSSGNYCLSSAL